MEFVNYFLKIIFFIMFFVFLVKIGYFFKNFFKKYSETLFLVWLSLVVLFFDDFFYVTASFISVNICRNVCFGLFI